MHAIATRCLLDNELHIIDARCFMSTFSSGVTVRRQYDYYKVKAMLGYGAEFRQWE